MGREEHCKYHWRVWGARSVWATPDLSPLTACVLSPSTLLRLQFALQGNCLRRALGCVHFPGLSRSGSGSRVLHKASDSAGPAFCALPGPSSSGNQVLGQRGCFDSSPARPSRSVFWVYNGRTFSDVPCVSSGELMTQAVTLPNPNKSWLATKSASGLV